MAKRIYTEEQKARRKAWGEANPERIKAYGKAFYQKNLQLTRDRAKAWNLAHPEEAKARGIRWRKLNPDAARLNEEKRRRKAGVKPRKIYFSKEERKRARADNERRYVARNPHRQIAGIFRKMIYKKLKDQNAKKSDRSLKILGCDFAWLAAWLEVQFQTGMTWENYGPVWHVDHIKPCKRFDLTDPHQQKLCFHWTNLQPLLAPDNLRKGAKWEEAA